MRTGVCLGQLLADPSRTRSTMKMAAGVHLPQANRGAFWLQGESTNFESGCLFWRRRERRYPKERTSPFLASCRAHGCSLALKHCSSKYSWELCNYCIKSIRTPTRYKLLHLTAQVYYIFDTRGWVINSYGDRFQSTLCPPSRIGYPKQKF